MGSVENLANGGKVIIYDSGKGEYYDRASDSVKTGSTVGNTGLSSHSWSSAGKGATGKEYTVSKGNNSINVSRPDGTRDTVTPGMSNYDATYKAMMQDLNNAGVNYTPSYTTTRADGSSYQTKNYTAGNTALKEALQAAAKNNGGSISINQYANDLLNGINGNNYNDTIQKMNTLGLGDWLPGKGIYATSGEVLPGNEFGYIGEDTAGDTGQWYHYGGQQYRLSGYGDDQSNFVDYVNGKTGNLPNTYMLFQGQSMQNNPYAQEDSEYLEAYNQALAQYNQAIAGNNAGTMLTSANGNVTASMGSNLANSLNSGNFSGLGTDAGGGDLLSQIIGLLDKSLANTQNYLSGQEDKAKALADEQKHQAWVDSQVNEVATRNRMAASGLGSSGAMDSALLGVQSNYNNAVAGINSDLSDFLSGITEQGLQALTDYYNNVTNYTYNISADQMSMALQQLQYELQMQEMQYAQAQQDWENAYNMSLLNQDASQQQWENAYNMLAAGVVNQSVADALGMTLAEAQAVSASLRRG